MLFLCFSLIICLAGMCGLNQRHRTKEQMTILFAVIDIKDLLWAFQAEHLHCCFHPSVDLYVHRSWDTGGRVCVNRRIKSKCYCSCRSAPLCIGQQIETMRWWEKDGVRERQRGQNERLGEVVCLERSGLSAIWWRWSEVLKINNVLNMSSAKIWPRRPQPEGLRMRHMTNIILDCWKLQSVSRKSAEMTRIEANLHEKGTN